MYAGVFVLWTVTVFWVYRLVFTPSPALSAYANGNPATGFAILNGRVSNGGIATEVSLRRVSRPL